MTFSIEELDGIAKFTAFQRWILKDMYERHLKEERGQDVVHFDDFYKKAMDNGWEYNEKGELL